MAGSVQEQDKLLNQLCQLHPVFLVGLRRNSPFLGVLDGDASGKPGHCSGRCQDLGSPSPWPSTCRISGDLLLLLLEIKCVWFPSFPVPLAHGSLLIWRRWLFPAPALDKPQLHISPPLGRKDSAHQCCQEDGEPPREGHGKHGEMLHPPLSRDSSHSPTFWESLGQSLPRLGSTLRLAVGITSSGALLSLCFQGCRDGLVMKRNTNVFFCLPAPF